MFQDFVFWGICSPKDLDWFLSQSSKYIIEIWNGQVKRRRDEINLKSLATAKQSLLIELCFASLGGSADSIKNDLSRYLPYAELSESMKKYLGMVTEETALVIQGLLKSQSLPRYVERAFNSNQELMEVIRLLSNG